MGLFHNLIDSNTLFIILNPVHSVMKIITNSKHKQSKALQWKYLYINRAIKSITLQFALWWNGKSFFLFINILFSSSFMIQFYCIYCFGNQLNRIFSYSSFLISHASTKYVNCWHEMLTMWCNSWIWYRIPKRLIWNTTNWIEISNFETITKNSNEDNADKHVMCIFNCCISTAHDTCISYFSINIRIYSVNNITNYEYSVTWIHHNA